MKINKQTKLEFHEFEEKVKRMLEVEKQLNTLGAPAGVFGVQIESIRKNLRNQNNTSI